MMSKRNLSRATRSLESTKKEEYLLIPGFLGFTLKGINKVEVPTRPGYVYVRVRGQTSEVVHAFNNIVAPVYGLPVLITRDEIDRTRYRVVGRDTGVYSNWGSSSPYLAKHGHTHSFIPEERGGGDVVWVYGRQMMPLAVYPSGTSGAAMVTIKPAIYYQNNIWHYAGGTATASLLPYKPTDNTARMVLIYLDSAGNPQLEAGSTYFNGDITGSSQIVPYLPQIGDLSHVPLAGIRLVSGTSEVVWANIYDVRPWIVGYGFVQTGTQGAPVNGAYVTIGNNATLSAERALTAGTGITILDGGANSTVTISASSFTPTGTSGVIGFAVGGDLSVGQIGFRNPAPRGGTIENVVATLYSAPTGSSMIVDVNKNGSTIFTTPANRPTILAGSLDDLSSIPDTTTFVQNDIFTCDVDQVGVSGSGAGLIVQIRYKGDV